MPCTPLWLYLFIYFLTLTASLKVFFLILALLPELRTEALSLTVLLGKYFLVQSLT